MRDARPLAPCGLPTSLASPNTLSRLACPAPPLTCSSLSLVALATPLAPARGCPGDLPAQENRQSRTGSHLRSEMRCAHPATGLQSGSTISTSATTCDSASIMQQPGTGQESRFGFFGRFRYSPRPGERGARARGHDRGILRVTPKPRTGREPAHGRSAGHGLVTGHRMGTGRGDEREPAPNTNALLQEPPPNARQDTL